MSAFHHRVRVGRQQFGKQAQLGGAVRGKRAVIIQVVARDVGETRGGQAHAVQPELIEAVAGSFEGRMAHARARQLRQRFGQRHRVRRGKPGAAVVAGRDNAERAEAGGLAACQGE